MMDTRTTMATELDRFFREVVLCLGGIFATRDCGDDLIWQVTRSIERIYRRNRERVLERDSAGEGDPAPKRAAPHPAVEDLLCRIGR